MKEQKMREKLERFMDLGLQAFVMDYQKKGGRPYGNPFRKKSPESPPRESQPEQSNPTSPPPKRETKYVSH